MRIVVELDEDVWMDRWCEWNESLPVVLQHPARSGSLKVFS